MTEEQRLWEYLNWAADDTDPRVCLRAWLAWVGLRGAPMPDAGVCPDGPVLLTWDKGRHHFEIEVPTDGPLEYFYMDRATDATWSYP